MCFQLAAERAARRCSGRPARVPGKPVAQEHGRIREIFDRPMRKICGPAMNRKPAFGENQMRIIGDAEIRFAVADHDFERAMPAAGTMTAFAVA